MDASEPFVVKSRPKASLALSLISGWPGTEIFGGELYPAPVSVMLIELTWPSLIAAKAVAGVVGQRCPLPGW